MAAFVVLAGGSGSRFGAASNKVYLPVAGRPVIAWSLAWAAEVPEVGPVVLVIRPGEEDDAAAAVSAAGLPSGSVEVAYGGDTRHRSEQSALDLLRGRIEAGELDVVAIHDGARPLAGAALLTAVIGSARMHGGAVPTVPEPRAWRFAPDGRLVPPVEALHAVQTPQAFRAGPLLTAYDAATAAGAEGTDTASALEGVPGVQVVSVPGHADNLKVTFAPDLSRAEDLLRNRRSRPR